jgi:glycine betaine/proline transport system permease protein
MASYDELFDLFGLRSWCDAGTTGGPASMADLLAQANGANAANGGFVLPSLDVLHTACGAIPRTRDMTAGLENLFLDIKDPVKSVLGPLTQPLSWGLQAALDLVQAVPGWVLILVLMAIVQFATRRRGLTAFTGIVFLILAFVDHLEPALQTLSIILVCTIICVVLGVPVGILMSRSDRLQRVMIPVLDMLQTLPTFVYLIPLIFLFSVTEPKLYGIAIILYAIVPAIRLTNLGIRLVDYDVKEAADAFGMTAWQKLVRVEFPLALPNIMAGINQTIMMSLSMVVIASLVSAPGLGTLVLRGINKLELGVGLVAGFAIVLLAILLDRVSKAALERINKTHTL